MAIVPDLSGTRPGRSGNIPLFDPRNRSSKERALSDDPFIDEVQLTLISGNQLVLPAKQTRNKVLFMTNAGADVVYISTNILTAAGGIPIYPASGLQLQGKATEQAFYCWGVAGVVLSIFEG